jgi:hypothetical protein
MIPTPASPMLFLISLAADAAPKIINAIHEAGGTVQHVGATLDADKLIIDEDIALLEAEQAEIAAKKAAPPSP